MINAQEELAKTNTENTHTENPLDAESSMEENLADKNEQNGAAKGKKKIGKATVKSKKIADKKESMFVS